MHKKEKGEGVQKYFNTQDWHKAESERGCLHLESCVIFPYIHESLYLLESFHESCD